MNSRINILIIIFICSINSAIPQKNDYTRYVNPFIGTGAADSLSLSGSNFPGACVPFGLVQLSPDTREYPDDPCSGYDYNDNTIVGFSHTHLSGTGCPDLYDFLFMPYKGEPLWKCGDDDGKIKGFRSKYDHRNESAEPGYYRVLLDDYKINVELTASEHCGMHKYTFPDNSDYVFMIDLEHSLVKDSKWRYVKNIMSQVRVIDEKTIEGYRIISGWAKLRKVYFRAEFSRPFKEWMTKAGDMIYPNNTVTNHSDLKLLLHFTENNTTPLFVRVGLSSVSAEGARENLTAEMQDFDFDKYRAAAKAKWNDELSKVDIQAEEKIKRIYYTGLYHLYIQPNNIADASGIYLQTDNTPANAPDKVHYSTFSLWDTYRAAHPFYTVTQEKKTADFINSMLRQYDTYGYLPIWHLWGVETYTMIGNHAIPTIVDAYIKGIKGFDYEHAYRAVKNTSVAGHRNAPVYLLDEFGFFPEDLQSQSVSITLEIAFNDWCVAEMARRMGKQEDYEYFSKRAESYKNLFDNTIGFFRAKNSSGEWVEPFNPIAYGGNGGYPFTEGNGWQYLWYVPQDVPAFIDLFGGKKQFTQKLDTFFTLAARPEDVNGNASGFIGQYAHGNEPSHHIAYLYDFTDEPWKASMYANKILNELYTDDNAGYSGNEDCGQMSAWYLFSALGFYPLNPSNSIYCIGSPIIPKATINLENGKQFKVITNNSGGKNMYIQKILLNGKNYEKNYITHSDIISGSTIEFFMGEQPNKKTANWEKPPNK